MSSPCKPPSCRGALNQFVHPVGAALPVRPGAGPFNAASPMSSAIRLACLGSASPAVLHLNLPQPSVILYLLSMGLIRLGEVVSLTQQSLGLGNLRADGKTGQRQVPLSNHINRLLRSLGDGEFVWTGKNGRLTRSGVQQAYRRLFARAGIKGRKVGPHTLRHTFGTMYCREGGNIRVLQEILGHSDLETTMIYVHLAGLDVAGDHASHSPVRVLEDLLAD